MAHFVYEQATGVLRHTHAKMELVLSLSPEPTLRIDWSGNSFVFEQYSGTHPFHPTELHFHTADGKVIKYHGFNTVL